MDLERLKLAWDREKFYAEHQHASVSPAPDWQGGLLAVQQQVASLAGYLETMLPYLVKLEQAESMRGPSESRPPVVSQMEPPPGLPPPASDGR